MERDKKTLRQNHTTREEKAHRHRTTNHETQGSQLRKSSFPLPVHGHMARPACQRARRGGTAGGAFQRRPLHFAAAVVPVAAAASARLKPPQEAVERGVMVVVARSVRGGAALASRPLVQERQREGSRPLAAEVRHLRGGSKRRKKVQGKKGRQKKIRV